MTIGSVVKPGTKGNIYGVEMWDSNIPLTIFLFFVAGLVQAGLFYGSAAIVDKVWPKRTNEEYELNQNLIDDEEKKNNAMNWSLHFNNLIKLIVNPGLKLISTFLNSIEQKVIYFVLNLVRILFKYSKFSIHI